MGRRTGNPGASAARATRRPPKISHRARQWQELLDQAYALLEDLEAGAELLDRAWIPSRWDGYPTSVVGGASGGIDPNPFATKIAERVDHELGLPTDDGRPRRDPDQDLIADAARDMRGQVLATLRTLRAAGKALERGRAKLPAHRPAATEAPGCVVCERYDVYAVAFKDGRCVPCYQYRRRSRARGEGGGLGLDAPERLVKTRPENATRRSMAERVDPTDVASNEDPKQEATPPVITDASLAEAIDLLHRRGAWHRGALPPTEASQP